MQNVLGNWSRTTVLRWTRWASGPASMLPWQPEACTPYIPAWALLILLSLCVTTRRPGK